MTLPFLSSLEKHEQQNAVSHGIGVLLGVLGAVFLLRTHQQTATESILSLWIYVYSVVLLFFASTAYHGTTSPERKKTWQKVDHISIYILIAGTYTPVTLIALKDSSGWALFYTVWIIALVGGVLKLFFTGKYERLSLFLYLLMGWLIVFDIQNLLAVFSDKATAFLVAGGFFYTVGVWFYRWEKLQNNHFIWHLFVLAGAISHYFMILNIA